MRETRIYTITENHSYILLRFQRFTITNVILVSVNIIFVIVNCRKKNILQQKQWHLRRQMTKSYLRSEQYLSRGYPSFPPPATGLIRGYPHPLATDLTVDEWAVDKSELGTRALLLDSLNLGQGSIWEYTLKNQLLPENHRRPNSIRYRGYIFPHIRVFHDKQIWQK